MTYGWAMLVVLLAIAALAYFYQSQKLKQEVCIIEPGFYCKEFRVYTNGILFVIQNNKGYDIQNVRLTVNGPNLVCYQSNYVTSLLDGQSTKIYFSCLSGISVNKNFRADINMTYSKLALNSLERKTEVVTRSFVESGTIPSSTIWVYTTPSTATIYLDYLGNYVGNSFVSSAFPVIVLPGQPHTIIAVNGSSQATASIPPLVDHQTYVISLILS